MADKRLGQHWLKDQSVLQAMVEAADVKKGDVVLEIGPGQGALTDKLAAAGADVTAVELDANLAAKLAKSFKDSNRIHIIPGDIRKLDLSIMPAGYKVVANIPYYLTAPLIRKLTSADNPPSLMALLVQKEVAERLAAEPGDLSILGVAVQFFGRVRQGRLVPPEAFQPPPEVSSQIVVVERYGQADRDAQERIMPLVRHGFANKRKTLLNSLAAGLNMEKPQVAATLKQAGLPANVRAQELTLKQWKQLYNLLEGV